MNMHTYFEKTKSSYYIRKERLLVSTISTAHLLLCSAKGTGVRANRFGCWEHNESLHSLPNDVYIYLRWEDAALLDVLDEPDLVFHELV